jgi:hypothetical protein
MTAAPTLVRYQDPVDVREQSAIAGFLAGYSGNTRVSYTTDLRLFSTWCAENRLRLLDVRRAHLEMFARTMEQEGRMRSTVARRLSTLCSFYRYCHLEGLLAPEPGRQRAAPEGRPRVAHPGLGPQRTGRPASPGRARVASRSRPDFLAGDERAAHQRSPRRRHRRLGH